MVAAFGPVLGYAHRYYTIPTSATQRLRLEGHEEESELGTSGRRVLRLAGGQTLTSKTFTLDTLRL